MLGYNRKPGKMSLEKKEQHKKLGDVNEFINLRSIHGNIASTVPLKKRNFFPFYNKIPLGPRES